MSTIETGIASLTQAAQSLTTTVSTKIADIDARVDEKRAEVDTFLANAQPETRYTQTIHMEGSTDYFYPVWWIFPNSDNGTSRITISRRFSLNGDTRPLDPVRQHQADLLLELEGNACAWCGGANFMEVQRFHERYNNTVSHVAFRGYTQTERLDPSQPFGTYTSPPYDTFGPNRTRGPMVYLRGGGLTYRIIKNWPGDVDFAFNDGTGRIVIDEAEHVNARWFTHPIHIDDRLAPIGSQAAYGQLLP